ncbi:ORF6N domain-containing protein [Olivibacter sp. XZL3]|uniref:ORF6N domain-containing protein n=1 Tax=Olivibacter sp. XZL3 TaxID=1735116 RepID=UPI0010649C20|nr:ORF6N domain-containing protein [Olivibacter sp. XZL3]
MLDRDLAELYGVETKVLKQAVKRNIDRFPEDFMFELEKKEFEVLRSQIVTSKDGRGGTRYLPMAFTEQGVAMLSSVLNSDRAIRVNIQIIRVFTKIRQVLADTTDLRLEIEYIKNTLEKQSHCHRNWSNLEGVNNLDNMSCLLWKIENGKIVEVYNFPEDQHKVDAFFGAVYR